MDWISFLMYVVNRQHQYKKNSETQFVLPVWLNGTAPHKPLFVVYHYIGPEACPWDFCWEILLLVLNKFKMVNRFRASVMKGTQKCSTDVTNFHEVGSFQVTIIFAFRRQIVPKVTSIIELVTQGFCWTKPHNHKKHWIPAIWRWVSWWLDSKSSH